MAGHSCAFPAVYESDLDKHNDGRGEAVRNTKLVNELSIMMRNTTGENGSFPEVTVRICLHTTRFLDVGLIKCTIDQMS